MNKKWPAAALAVITFAIAPACVRLPSDCAAAATVVGLLECQAVTGDKAAQLELGRRYEEGAGTKRDLRNAADLYRAAATFTPGTTYVYVPPVGKAPGSVTPLRSGADRPGLAEAKFRLALLYLRGRGARLNFKKARQLLEAASAEGFEPASAKLRELDRLPKT